MDKRLPHNVTPVVRSGARRGLLAAGFLAVVTPGAMLRGQSLPHPPPLMLVAQPALRDPLFGAGVVLALRTPAGEMIGLMLNRMLGEPAPPMAGAEAGPVRRGGPLAPEALFVLAENAQPVEGTLDAGDGIRFAAGAAMAGRLLAATGTVRRRVFRGYAGWAPGQLEREIGSGFWWPLAVEADLVFDPEPALLWERLSAPRRAVRRRPVPERWAPA